MKVFNYLAVIVLLISLVACTNNQSTNKENLSTSDSITNTIETTMHPFSICSRFFISKKETTSKSLSLLAPLFCQSFLTAPYLSFFYSQPQCKLQFYLECFSDRNLPSLVASFSKHLQQPIC